MHAGLPNFLGARLKPKALVHDLGICGNIIFGLGPLLLMTSPAGCFCLQRGSAVHLLAADSAWNLVASAGNRINTFGQRIRLLSALSRNDWPRIGVFGASYGFSSLISVPFGLKNCCAEYSSKAFSNFSDLPCLEADRRPDMLSFFSNNVKGRPESLGKELDKKDDEAEAERLKKEGEQKKRDEEAENLRKEKEMEDKIGPPPEKPLPGDCCGNGCTPCVWDTYGEELEDYKKLRNSVEGSE